MIIILVIRTINSALMKTEKNIIYFNTKFRTTTNSAHTIFFNDYFLELRIACTYVLVT
jgi:hypothetical protein